MFDVFTEKAIKSIMLAQEETKRLGHDYLDTEQLLLGIIGEGTGIASKSLKEFGVKLKDARIAVEERIGKGEDLKPWWQQFSLVAKAIPFRPRAKRILELSWEESQKLNQHHIGTEHLLLGLIREATESLDTEDSGGVALQVLQQLGVDLPALREHILQQIRPHDDKV